MNHVPDMTRSRAYDQARREFYQERLQEDVERRVAKEEALATGAFFGKSMLQIGMELEDKEYERWKKWASREIVAQEQLAAAAYTSNPAAAISEGDSETEAALDEVGDSIPAQGQKSLGGMPVRP